MTPYIGYMVAALVYLACFVRGLSVTRCACYGFAAGAAIFVVVPLVG